MFAVKGIVHQKSIREGTRARRRLPSVASTTDEMDDLEPVAILHGGLRPLGARHDAAVVLDGDAVGLQPHGFHQFRQRADLIEDALFPVDDKLHGI